LPEKYNLHLEEKQENDQMIMMEYIPKGQNWDNYDIIITKLVSKNLAKFRCRLFLTIIKSFFSLKPKIYE
jgi:hypothetical protein